MIMAYQVPSLLSCLTLAFCFSCIVCWSLVRRSLFVVKAEAAHHYRHHGLQHQEAAMRAGRLAPARNSFSSSTSNPEQDCSLLCSTLSRFSFVSASALSSAASLSSSQALLVSALLILPFLPIPFISFDFRFFLSYFPSTDAWLFFSST